MAQTLLELLEHPDQPPEQQAVSASSDGRRNATGSSRFSSAASSAAAAAASAQLASESDFEGPRGADIAASATGGAGGFHAFSAGFGGNAFARLVFAVTESPDPFVDIEAKQFAVALIQAASQQLPGKLLQVVTAAVGEPGVQTIANYATESGLEGPVFA
jgi:hypothetical protein